jgi:hypothetical protein
MVSYQGSQSECEGRMRVRVWSVCVRCVRVCTCVRRGVCVCGVLYTAMVQEASITAGPHTHKFSVCCLIKKFESDTRPKSL